MAFELKTFGGFSIQIDDARELQKLIFDEQVRPDDMMRDYPSGQWTLAREHPQAGPIFRALRDRLAQNANAAFLASGTAIAATHQDDGQPSRPEWHVKFEGRSLGPLKEERFVEMISRGEIPGDAQVYASGAMKWRTLSEVDALRGFLPMPSALAQAPKKSAKASSSIVISGFGPKAAAAAPPAPAPLSTNSASLLPSLPDDLKQFVVGSPSANPSADQPKEKTLMRPNPSAPHMQKAAAAAAAAKQQRQMLILILGISAAILVLAIVFLIALV